MNNQRRSLRSKEKTSVKLTETEPTKLKTKRKEVVKLHTLQNIKNENLLSSYRVSETNDVTTSADYQQNNDDDDEPDLISSISAGPSTSSDYYKGSRCTSDRPNLSIPPASPVKKNLIATSNEVLSSDQFSSNTGLLLDRSTMSSHTENLSFSNYPTHTYPPHAYPPQAYPPQAYPPQVYPPHSYPPHHTNTPIFTTQMRGECERVNVVECLEKCLSNGSFDIYKAGTVIHNEYLKRNQTVIESCTKFAKQNLHSCTTYSLPPIESYSNPDLQLIMMHGQLIYGLLTTSLPTVNIVKSEAERDFRSLTGSVFKTTKLNLRYPSYDPFSGGPIYLTETPVGKRKPSEDQAHVLLKGLLVQVLGRACTHPTEIQTRYWSLPFDTEYSTHTPFPESLYNDLRIFFLHYFGIESDELSSGEWDDSFVDLDCLRLWETVQKKKRRYRILSGARSLYMSRDGFHRCLREAVTELRTAVYTDPIAGETFGTWSYRKRNLKRTRQDAPAPVLHNVFN